jgi:hypothetical protein
MRHIPDHVGEVGLLLGFAVDGEPYGPPARMPNLAHRVKARTGRRMLKGFARFPRSPRVFRLVLQITTGHVEAHAVAKNAV